MAPILIAAPLDGWVAPLDEVPDPVFAERMMGDGLAIDPVGDVLHAPCAGVILNLHAARHALTLRTDGGAEILMHIGLETVALGGEGFEALAREGDRVAAGQPLIRFDLDLVARRARSVITPIVLTNSNAFRIARAETGRMVTVGEPLMELFPLAAIAAAAPADAATASRAVRITHAHGLHARPAALIALEVKRLGLPVQASFGGRTVSALSTVALMGLGVSAGGEIVLTAAGPGAEAALAILAELIEQRINSAPQELAAATVSRPAASPATAPGEIAAVRAAPGLAAGPAARLPPAEVEVRTLARAPAEELAGLERAIDRVRERLAAEARRASGARRDILEAHQALVDDPELMDAARRAISQGLSAGVAWRGAAEAQSRALQALGDERLAARAADLRDLERQVLLALGGSEASRPRLPPGAIVLAEDLTPSEVMALRDAGAAGVCTAGGGPTSHAAILAAALDLPALVAAGPGVLQIPDGTEVILDADAGVLRARPSPAELKRARAELTARHARKASAVAAAHAPCRTADGVRIEVFANVGGLADAELAVANGAEGCGLLRTEFLFLDRSTAPDEAEQAAQYQAIARAFGDRPVIVRTLDVGSDKPAPYLDLPRGDNPALGVRGVRVSLRRPELLDAQLRAILAVDPPGQCRIMVPMVASVAELKAVRASAQAVCRELGRPMPELGVMIETPAAAATADLIAAEADFLSIGTNDLAQYALAIDRGDPGLAAEVDGLHPAVLRLIRLTVQGAERRTRPVGVCGGLASDLRAVPILLGLGVTELSAAPALVPEVKAVVRTLALDACREVAERACAQASAAEVRALAVPSPAAHPIGSAR